MTWGLLNRVVPDAEVLAAAQDLARAVAANAPLSIEASLALSDRAFAEEETALWQANDAALQRLSASGDVTEGIGAFFENARRNGKGARAAKPRRPGFRTSARPQPHFEWPQSAQVMQPSTLRIA